MWTLNVREECQPGRSLQGTGGSPPKIGLVSNGGERKRKGIGGPILY